MEKFKREPVEVPISELKPLDIKCSDTRCPDGYHCFKTSKKSIETYGKKGVCNECGADLIDWKRLFKNNVKDSVFIFKSMNLELVRYVFWHCEIDSLAIERVHKRGLVKLEQRTYSIVRNAIGKAVNYREGRQTPKGNGEIIHYAQHATGTCCRVCLEYWHNIKQGHDLTQKQIEYCVELIMLYIKARVPNIEEDPK